MFDKLKNYFIEMIFPARCVWCERLGSFICTACEEKILKIKKQTCPFCGRIEPSGRTCPRCKRKHHLCGALSYGYFKDERLKEIVCQYKYKDIFALSPYLGRLLADLLAREDLSFDIITYVPLSRKKLVKRGYNQSELLARELGRSLDKDVLCSLKKKKETKSQVGLRRSERHKNLKDSFEVINKKEIVGKKILLVDDVLTTGATLEACAKALKKANAKKTWGITLAKE